jgi:hypothetical protein
MHLVLRALTTIIVIREYPVVERELRTVDETVLRGLEAPFMALYSLVRAFFEAPRERAPNFV